MIHDLRKNLMPVLLLRAENTHGLGSASGRRIPLMRRRAASEAASNTYPTRRRPAFPDSERHCEYYCECHSGSVGRVFDMEG